MRTLILALLLVVGLASCGDDSDSSGQSGTGVTGQVLIGPTCPVETKGEPCEDAPAISVDLTVYEPSESDPMTAGEVVTQETTEDDGTFQIDLEPGSYLVTATAGMFCDVVGVAVEEGQYAEIRVPCDSGIR